MPPAGSEKVVVSPPSGIDDACRSELGPLSLVFETVSVAGSARATGLMFALTTVSAGHIQNISNPTEIRSTANGQIAICITNTFG